MKKLSSILISCFFFSQILLAQDVTVSFPFPSVVTNDGYVALHFDGCVSVSEPGEPQIPCMFYNLLIAQNSVTDTVIIKDIEYYDEVITGRLMPAPTPQPISQRHSGTPATEENASIYSSSLFPEQQITYSKTAFLCGYGITPFIINAVEYYPQENIIKVVKNITFSNISKASKTELKVRKDQRTIKRIKNIANDYSLIDTYSVSSQKSEEEVDLLIITNNLLASSFENYVNYKERTGYFTKVVSVDDIAEQYDGVDLQDKIRNCIKDYYENNNLQYVLLGGDADGGNSGQCYVPCRGLACTEIDENDIPADLYYSNLDGTWNDNNNNLWGEREEVDPISEISVGRICASNIQDVNNSIAKLIKYQESPVLADLEKALMVGEQLNDDPVTWGGTYKDEIADGGSYTYISQGIPENFTVSTLYDRNGFWNGNQLKNFYSTQGIHLLNHLGHSSTTYNMKLSTSDLNTNNFTNDGVTHSYCIGYTQGCYAGSFDNRETWAGYYSSDCFAEEISTMETGNVATIANSRYGWYVPGGTTSSSQFYDRMFYTGFLYEGCTKIGDANGYSKDTYPNWFSNNYYRWTAYELNLFGDPTMDIWTAQPTVIVADYNTTIPINTTEYIVTTDTPFARVSISKDGELLCRVLCDETGNAVLPIPNGSLIPTASYELNIIAHNKYHFSETISVLDASLLDVIGYSFDDATEGNNDDIMNYGEIISLTVTLKNIGTLTFEAATASVSVDKEWAAVINPVITVNDINAGSALFLPTCNIQISPEAEIDDLTVTYTIGEDYSFSFTTPIAAAMLEFVKVGFGSDGEIGTIQSAEDGIMKVAVANNGNYPAKNISFDIVHPDKFIVFGEASSISEIDASSYGYFEIPYSIADNCPEVFISPSVISYNDEMSKTGSFNTPVFVGNTPIALVDLANIGFVPVSSLTSVFSFMDIPITRVTTISQDIFDFDKYPFIFMSLNNESFAYTLTNSNIEIIENYLNNHGVLYIEGNVLWNSPVMNDLFGLDTIANKYSSFTKINGVAGTFTEGMLFSAGTFIDMALYPNSATPVLQRANDSICITSVFTAPQDEEWNKTEYSAIASTSYYLNIVRDPAATSLLRSYINYTDACKWTKGIISLGEDHAICKNESLVLNAGENYVRFFWNGEEGEKTYNFKASDYLPGDAVTITVLAIDDAGYFSEGKITITINDCDGIDEYDKETVKVYPNPVSDVFFYENAAENSHILIYDNAGNIVLSQQNAPACGKVMIHSLKKGVYFVKFYSNNFSSIIKIVVI